MRLPANEGPLLDDIQYYLTEQGSNLQLLDCQCIRDIFSLNLLTFSFNVANSLRKVFHMKRLMQDEIQSQRGIKVICKEKNCLLRCNIYM